MTEPFQLRHRAAAKGIAYVRIWPLLLAGVLLAIAAGSSVALASEDLVSGARFSALVLIAICLPGVVFLLHHAWRTWPAASASLVVMRMDEEGPQLRKGRFRDNTWFGVSWSAIQAVTFTPLIDPKTAEISRLRVLRFVPHPAANVPNGPPGVFDHLLGLPPRESVLAFVAVQTWDEELRELLDWVRRNRPDLRVDDGVPVG